MYYGGKCCRNLSQMRQQNDQHSHHIHKRHKRHNHLCHGGNPLNPSDNNECHAHGQYQPGYHNAPRIGVAKQMHRTCRLRIKKALYRTGNSVDLRKGSDAEQTDSHAEECEDLSQPAEFSAHTVLNIVKRSADHMSIRFHHAVLDRQKTFRILGRRAKQRRNPHPEQGARTACHDRRRHSHDITGTDRCRQRRAECAETRHLSVLAVFFVCNNVSDRKRQLRDLKSPQTDRQKYANRKDQHDQGNSPDKIINDL